ncbi:MAG: hypothetical protein DCC67_19230 [Planctomycetota bacterium]|nr:MAG: hypothetical protein DCC67_19230 [Planctomycetota bacterium]
MPQPKLHWSAYLWPGLVQLWTRGSWAALALAVGFTALVNLLAVATFIWTEWLSPEVRWGSAGVLAAVWILAWAEARADWRRLLAERATGESAADPAELADRLFRQAQASYLAGDWVAAEQTLLKLLKHEPRDAEARLMLATLWRHEGRLDAATEELDRLERLEASAGWRDEIAWERERIAAAGVIDDETLKLDAAGELTSSGETENKTETLERRLAA